MKTFSMSGTFGDAYINVMKLYPLRKEDISVNHYTIHKPWQPMIKEIYSLLPNVSVNFVSERDTENEQINSHFTMDDLEYDPFPLFKLPDVDLPKDFNCACARAGKGNESRTINIDVVPHDKEIVWIGGTPCGLPGIDLGGKLSFLESFSVITSAKHMYCPQGVLCFFSMSQRVPTTVWLNGIGDVDGFFNRYTHQWDVEIIDWRS